MISSGQVLFSKREGVVKHQDSVRIQNSSAPQIKVNYNRLVGKDVVYMLMGGGGDPVKKRRRQQICICML